MRRWFLLLAATLTMAAAAAQGQSMVGDWSIKLGATCSMMQEWNDDDAPIKNVMMMGYGEQGKMFFMAFGYEKWSFADNETFVAEFSVDDDWNGVQEGVATDGKMAVFPFAASKALLDALRNGEEIYFEIRGKGDDYAGTYPLDDVKNALSVLDTCRKESK